MSFLTFFTGFVMTHWAVVSIFTLMGALAFLLHQKPSFFKLEKASNVDLVIVSKASKSVKGVLFDTIKKTCEDFSEYNVNVVVDEGSELNGNLEDFVNSFPNTNLVIVPKSYKVKAIAKGRAINYFIDNYVQKDRWYAFIDDDNRILDDNFLKEVTYYDKKGYKAANGILRPRPGRSKIAYVADWLRFFDDHTIFRFGTGLAAKPFNGFHGELLLAKGDVLSKIGFNRKTLTEDFAFARELLRKGYKVWHSDTEISILSPHTVNDFIKQRRRWYKGISRDFWSAPIGMKLFAGLRTLDWKVAILGSWVIFPLWFFMEVPLWLIMFNFIGFLYYLAAYSYGAIQLKRETGKWTSYFYVLGLPFYGMLETIAPHWISGKGFQVINKS